MSEELSTPAPIIAIPSLRGDLKLEGSTHVCRGVWALSDAAHTLPGQTSQFEFRLVKPIDGSNAFPNSGTYQGWFYLKGLRGETKIEDREINLRFIAVVGEEGHRVEGEGSNKFGKFKVYGTLSEGGHLQMYREYMLKDTHPVSLKRKSTSTTASPSKPNVISSDTRDTTTSTTAGNGNGVPRARKSNSVGNNFGAKAAKAAALIVPSDNNARTHRLSQHMVRCGEILKDLTKQPQSLWFNSPVDFVALKIPDYPTIVKEPMDFSTIQKSLDTHSYASPEAFAEHVRLVFKNAIAYNTMRDNPVHIAARELSHRFEDRFRQLMSQLTAAGYGHAQSIDGAGISRSTSVSGAAKRVKTKPAGLKRNLSYGPGQMALPLAMDGGLVEMQRKIQEMQNELSSLRAQVKQNEVKTELEQHVKDSHNPLSLEEKKALIAQIHKLPSAKMDEVVDIIKSATDVKDEGDEVEISLDDLDTHTLRKLQAFVYDVQSKRSYASDIAQKKPKKDIKPKIAPKVAGKAQGFGSAAVVSSVSDSTYESNRESSDLALFGDDHDQYDPLARHDSDGEEAGEDDEGFDFDLVPNGDVKMEE